MTTKLLSKQELIIFNKRTLKYPLAVAEKDYFLAIVSKIIFDSSLRDKIVFKGGTAIHHCYLSQYRFSEDLDFTAIDKNITPEEIKKVLENNDFLRVKKEYFSKATIKFEKVQYSGPLVLANNLKVEIDFIQNVLLPARQVEYKNEWNIKTDVMIMDAREICAEKIRACSDRARYRDFYDLFLMFETFNPAWNEILVLIRKKEIRKTISKKSISQNWLLALQEKKKELAQIHYKRPVEDDSIKSFIDNFSF
ncbi:MAG: hypothetical protein AUJ85_03820 [Elusimicrobia bacterium CG1_02_37_114]|nr:MAG: hypothetical protein AUJ85_03820 [Elusimicrobia bacterium CG1_02_37_114]